MKNTGLRVGMIWAQSLTGAIGKDGDMPWHLPEDLAHFKKMTLGKPVIMGRRTWESLPVKFRPLPGRQNLVVTRNVSFAAQGATVVASLEAAFALVKSEPDAGLVDVWIMGGGQLYQQGMAYAKILSVTQINIAVEGADTFAPQIDGSWQLHDATEILTAGAGLEYQFQLYTRD